MKCQRCGKSSGDDKRFSKKKRLCNACSVTISQYKKAGKELPPAKRKKEAAGGTASLKEGKIYGAEMKCSECGIGAASAKLTQKKNFSRKHGKCRVCLDKKKGKAEKPLTLPSPAGGEEKKAKGKAPLDTSTGSGRTVIPPQADDLKLTLDFSEYESLYDVIVDEARDQIRTPEMQALFMLKEVLNAIKP